MWTKQIFVFPLILHPYNYFIDGTYTRAFQLWIFQNSNYILEQFEKSAHHLKIKMCQLVPRGFSRRPAWDFPLFGAAIMLSRHMADWTRHKSVLTAQGDAFCDIIKPSITEVVQAVSK